MFVVPAFPSVIVGLVDRQRLAVVVGDRAGARRAPLVMAAACVAVVPSTAPRVTVKRLVGFDHGVAVDHHRDRLRLTGRAREGQHAAGEGRMIACRRSSRRPALKATVKPP